MNPRALGMKTEKMAKEELLADGWTVYQVPPSRKWQKQEDIFGIFDLFCVKKGKFKLIQVKTNWQPSLKPFRDFWNDNLCICLSVEVWIYFTKQKVWRKIIL